MTLPILLKSNSSSPFNSLMDVFLNDLENSNFLKNNFNPSFDIKENSKSFFIDIELPGIKKTDLKISIDKDTLIVQGEKKIDDNNDLTEISNYSRSYGNFESKISLSKKINENTIEAKLENGILSIKLDKNENDRPKEVSIN
jgi:HSP20 family protein